ncbi:arabinosyltransferase domain-containing protein [Geodermatophilus sp. DSM 44513]|uniref:arabinosyltransferase domain-containing protein n=1 Tax=Geodermatophilus sp. DSM 44513 TaxID=1528104 RepID=UPI0028F74C13|nr:arabinosyltransferase domain-containing protein [Geodermatophilus sp. DSM 44513]WNV74799.1 arabinosyltransferase domain-containing protein [Geodermatophilus sp. DSM 44513]
MALPLAPVVADRTVVSWPAQGELPASTTAYFVPYRPAELSAEVPCAAVQAAVGAPERTTLLATTIVRDGGPAPGLVVDAGSGELRVLLNGRLVQTTSPAPTGCDVRVDSDDTATTVSTGAGPPTVLPLEPVPEVFAFTTDLTPEEAAGTTVTARTRTWFESRPSAVKSAMTAGHVLLVLTALVLLARWAPRPAGPRATRQPVPGRALRAACDAAVLLALTAWVVIAPQTDDDGYASMTIRNGLVSGDIGNYYHWANASEAPFTLVQQVLAPIMALSAEPLWLRLPSYLVGVATWFVVSRGVLGAVLPREGRSRLVPVLTALCFLGWWLPYNTGLRPEPFVALAAAAVLALLLRATGPGARRPLPALGAAALVAGLSLSVTPSSVVVLAPVLVFLPRIWRVLRTADGTTGRSWASTAGLAALLACAASSGLVVMFADQSWHGVAKATELHTLIGPSFSWFEEPVRYAALLGGGNQGSATKRLPVLLTLVAVLLVGLLVARRVRAVQGFRDVHLLTASAALSFALLAITPSKWSHHFGAVAGVGVPLLVVAGALLLQVARDRPRDRVVAGTGLVGAVLLALAAALSFSATNTWFLASGYGVSYREVPVRPLGVPLDNPVVWLVPAALVAVAVGRWRRRGPGRPASAVLVAPVLVAAAALLASVTLLLVGFTVAPLRQAEAGSYSLTAVNLQTLAGGSCGLGEAVEVLVDAPGGPLRPIGDAASLDGFAAGDGYPGDFPPPEPAGSRPAPPVWGSLVGGELATGTLVSPWFPLPALDGDQDLAVTAAGRTGGANRLEVEFGRAEEDAGVTAVGRRGLDDGPVGAPTWRPLAVAADDVPAAADRVRVVASDAATDVGGWLAVTGPRVRTAEDLQTFLAGRGDVLVDWPLAWHVPCVQDLPVVSDGLAQTPEVLLAAPPDYAAISDITYRTDQGGSFAGVTLADGREVPSRLVGAPQEEWGRVVLLDHGIDRDAYDRVTTTTPLWGWEGDR